MFAFIDRTTISTQLRLEYTFQLDLTLEAYAEPFAASGRFYGFGELAAAGSRELRTYGEAPGTSIEEDPDGVYAITDGDDAFALEEPDFNVRSMRSNLVLRWEWLPGSTLFLVWQQDRATSTERGNEVGVGDVWDTFDAPGDNFLRREGHVLATGGRMSQGAPSEPAQRMRTVATWSPAEDGAR